MLIDLDREEIETLIQGLDWKQNETVNNEYDRNLTKKLEYFLEEWTEIEK